MGRGEKNDRLKAKPRQTDRLDEIFLKFGPVDIPESIVDAEVQKEDIRLHNIDVFAECSDAIKGCFLIPGTIHHLDPARPKGFFQDIGVASGHTAACGDAAAADQQFHERPPGSGKMIGKYCISK
jgi:hypothetical protein